MRVEIEQFMSIQGQTLKVKAVGQCVRDIAGGVQTHLESATAEGRDITVLLYDFERESLKVRLFSAYLADRHHGGDHAHSAKE